MDISSLLGGPRPLFVSAGLLQRQLETETDTETAAAISSFVGAFDATLRANPAIAALLPSQQALAVAGLYGGMLRQLTDATATPGMADTDRAKFVSLRERVDQLVRLSLVSLPTPEAINDGPSDDAIIDDVLSASLSAASSL